MTKERTTKRLKIYEVSASVISEMMKFAVFNRIPDDAMVHSVFHNPQKNSFSVVVESKEFKEVKEGELIPLDEKAPVLSADMMKMQIDREMIAMQKKTLKILT